MKNNIKLQEINERVFEVCASIKVLSQISWPLALEEDLHKAVEGQGSFPKIEYPTTDYSSHIEALQKIASEFTPETPLEVFTSSTIKSYIAVASMVMAVKTPEFSKISQKIYGGPHSAIPGSYFTSLDIANRLVTILQGFEHPNHTPLALNVDAESLAEYLQIKSTRKFGDQSPKISVEPEMLAKASASSTKVSIKKGAMFSRYDRAQLFNHELMVHSLTEINGRAQPRIKCLGLASPRTTGTQEGLATFSEIITGVVDIRRLMRLALRVIAIDMAMSGANFIEVVKYFRANGQEESESIWSAARIFRGGTPEGNIVFMKDSVYMSGLLRVMSLFRWAFKNNRINVLNLLFCGRLAIEDCFYLEQDFNEGVIETPKFLPTWFEYPDSMAASLSLSFLYRDLNLSDFEIDFIANKQ